MTPNSLYQEIGKNIRRHRKGRRTQAQLAAEIGISRASLANIEAGRQQVLVHYLYSIASALDLDSPTSLLPEPVPLQTAEKEALRLPLPKDGLSNQQRQDIQRVLGGGLNNNDNK